MLPSNRCCKDTLKLLIGPFGASDTWLSLLLSFLFIQERVFLTISNYIFTAIFVSEMTLKVTFYNLSLFTASAGSKEMPSLFACFNWLAFSSQTEHTISFFFFYSQFPGSSGENSYAMSLISGWLLCIFPYLLHVSLFLFSPLLWFNFSRVWAVIFVILNLFVSLSFFSFFSLTLSSPSSVFFEKVSGISGPSIMYSRNQLLTNLSPSRSRRLVSPLAKWYMSPFEPVCISKTCVDALVCLTSISP